MKQSQQNQKGLSKVQKWVLNKFIPKSSNRKIDIMDGFSGQDLKEAVNISYTTDELAQKAFRDDIFDPKYRDEDDAKQRVYDAVSKLKKVSENNNWGFYIRSVPREVYKEQKILDGLSIDKDFNKQSDYREYRVLVYDRGLLLEIASLYDNNGKTLDLIIKQTRWCNRGGAVAESTKKSYGRTADNLLKAARQYTNLLTSNNMFLPEEISEKLEEMEGEENSNNEKK